MIKALGVTCLRHSKTFNAAAINHQQLNGLPEANADSSDEDNNVASFIMIKL